MMPKVLEKTDSEIQIICNSEIHDCWVKDCIKKSHDTRHINGTLSSLGVCIQTLPRRLYAWLNVCSSRLLFRWWMVPVTLLSQTWPGFLDSPPAFKEIRLEGHLRRGKQQPHKGQQVKQGFCCWLNATVKLSSTIYQSHKKNFNVRASDDGSLTALLL